MNKLIKKLMLVLGTALCAAIIGFSPASAANGPDEGETSYAYIDIGSEVIGQNAWGNKYCCHYVYMSDNVKRYSDENIEYSEYELVEDEHIKYDKKTNTLTLDNYTGTEINANMMGDDFKIELKGVNTIEKLYVYTDSYGCNLTLTGKGTLNICGGTFFEEDQLYGKSGLRLFCESSTAKTKLTIDKNVTLHVEGDGSYTYPLIAVYNSCAEKNGIVLNSVKLNGSYISESTTEFDLYEDIADSDDFFFICEKGGTEYYCRNDSYFNFDTEEIVESFGVYKKSENPVLVEKFKDRDEMIAAGYEIKTRMAYNYIITGKQCTISAKTEKALEKDSLFAKDGICYAVLTKGTKKKTGTVTVVGTDSWDMPSANIVIPKTVKNDGVTYKVTAINEMAFFYGNGIKSVTIGANVKTIGKEAFSGIWTLEELIIKTKKLKSTTVKADAFADTPDTVMVKVPSGKVSSYKKILQARGLSKKATVK